MFLCSVTWLTLSSLRLFIEIWNQKMYVWSPSSSSSPSSFRTLIPRHITPLRSTNMRNFPCLAIVPDTWRTGQLDDHRFWIIKDSQKPRRYINHSLWNSRLCRAGSLVADRPWQTCRFMESWCYSCRLLLPDMPTRHYSDKLTPICLSQFTLLSGYTPFWGEGTRSLLFDSNRI